MWPITGWEIFYMDKKNIIIAGIIFVAILVSAVILGKDEIYGMIQMV